jgi:transcriptional regulator with XRE-family HTH domain
VRGFTQKRVAAILELKSTAVISRWEKGLCLPETSNLGRLAGIYRTTTDALLQEYFLELHREMIRKEEMIIESIIDV